MMGAELAERTRYNRNFKEFLTWKNIRSSYLLRSKFSKKINGDKPFVQYRLQHSNAYPNPIFHFRLLSGIPKDCVSHFWCSEMNFLSYMA